MPNIYIYIFSTFFDGNLRIEKNIVIVTEDSASLVLFYLYVSIELIDVGLAAKHLLN